MIYDFIDASESLKREVWKKGVEIKDREPFKWRKDNNNKWIYYPDFMDSISKYGWGIGYIIAPEDGGTDDISNLIPINIDR